MGLVLVGGASTRMGTDKALLEHDGQMLGVRVLRALSAAGIDDRRIAGGTQQHAVLLGVPQLADRTPPLGPVVAISDAWDQVGDRDLVVAPCDLPWIEGSTVMQLLEAADAAGAEADVILASIADRPQYPLGVWTRRARADLRHAVESGARRFSDALSSFTVVHVALGDNARDADTPASLRRRSGTQLP